MFWLLKLGSHLSSPPQGVLSNLSSITDLGGFDPVWLFMVVGGVMFILGFAGCIGALRENTFLLKFVSQVLLFCHITSLVCAQNTPDAVSAAGVSTWVTPIGRFRQQHCMNYTSPRLMIHKLANRSTFPLSCSVFIICAQERWKYNNFGRLLDFISIEQCGTDRNNFFMWSASIGSSYNLSPCPLATVRQASEGRANVAFLHLSFSPSPLLLHLL